jgi:hypothetical protein
VRSVAAKRECNRPNTTRKFETAPGIITLQRVFQALRFRPRPLGVHGLPRYNGGPINQRAQQAPAHYNGAECGS